MHVEDGPAHHAVQSRMRRPASGSSARRRASGAGPGARLDRPRVLAQAGRRRAGPERLVVDHVRRPGHLEVAVRMADEHAPGAQVRMLEHGAAAVDGRHRDPQQRRLLDDLLGRVRPRVRAHHAVPLVDAALAPEDGRQLLVVEHVGPLDEHEEVVELLAGVGVEADPAVERRLDRRQLAHPWRRHDLGAALQRPHEVGVGVGGDRHALEPRHVDVLAVARQLRTADGRGAADRGEHGGDVLGDAAGRVERLHVGQAPPGRRATLRLHGELAHRPLLEGPAAPIGRDRQAHEAREAGVVEGLLVLAGREGLDHQVGALEQRLDLGVLGRADHGALRAVQEAEEGAVVLAQVGTRHRPAAQGIAVGPLHLDDVGAGVGEELRRVGARDAGGQVDDPEVSEAVHPRILAGSHA